MPYPSNNDSVAQDQIRAFVERVERIEAEVKDLNKGKAEVFAEAKGNGFDVKALKIVIGKRRQDHAERMELEAIVELYEAALGVGTAPRDADESGTVDATRAPARPDRETRRRQRLSESMDDHKALVDEIADAGLISEEARQENKRLADAVATKLGNGPIDPEPTQPHDPTTGEIIEPAASMPPGVVADQGGEGASVLPAAPIQPATANEAPSVANDANAGGENVDAAAHKAGDGAGAPSPAPSTIVRLPPKKPLRPYCLQMHDLTKCGGYGKVHCHECLVAHADAEGLTA